MSIRPPNISPYINNNDNLPSSHLFCPFRRPPKDHTLDLPPNLHSMKMSQDSNKTSIPLKTAKQAIQDFKTFINPIHPIEERYEFNPKEFSFLSFSNDERQKDAWYFHRHVLFSALSIHIFPVISLFHDLKRVTFDIEFHAYKKKDLVFLGQFLNHLALLPHLTSLYFRLSSRIELSDFEGWELDGSVSITSTWFYSVFVKTETKHRKYESEFEKHFMDAREKGKKIVKSAVINVFQSSEFNEKTPFTSLETLKIQNASHGARFEKVDYRIRNMARTETK